MDYLCPVHPPFMIKEPHNRLKEKAIETFQEHFEHLVLYVNAYVDSIQTAEDIVQDLFLKLWEKERLVGCKPAFLYICARNAALNYLRTRNLETFPVDSIDRYAIEDDMEVEMDYMNKLERIYEAVESLPPQCREVLKKIYFEEKSYAEVAEEMNLSLNTVKTHIYLAIKTLRRNFVYVFVLL